MNIEPQKEHRWLHRLVGEWTYEGEATREPGDPPETFKGTESVRSLGGLWTVAEARGETSGGSAATMIMTLGYDPQRKRYVGTWIESMMTYLWVYDGALDPTGRVLTLEAAGPMDPAGKKARYRDVITLMGDDCRELTSYQLRDGGTWHAFMTATYWRKA
jgi:Protein of unknown function (DUF1579)